MADLTAGFGNGVNLQPSYYNGNPNLICTCHYYGGSGKASDLQTAANYWKADYRALGGNFTINLCNEWGSHNITSNACAAAYNSAISTGRSVYSGPIVIDIPGYGQETLPASAAVKGTKINDANIILSAHIYPNGYNQGRGHNLHFGGRQVAPDGEVQQALGQLLNG